MKKPTEKCWKSIGGCRDLELSWIGLDPLRRGRDLELKWMGLYISEGADDNERALWVGSHDDKWA